MRVRVVQLYQRADAHARGAACRRSMLAAEPTRPVPVWLWFEYSRAPPRYIQLNIQALRRQAPWPLFSIKFVNRSTIAQHVPDLPAEFWRMPTRVAYSDAGRLALLAHHGGIYLDADFLVSSSMRPIHALLKKVDVVGYPLSPVHGAAASASECSAKGEISANLMAAAPNATLFRRAWDLFRKLLPRPCKPGVKRKIYICCSDGVARLPKCRVPHALTDLMLGRVRLQRWPLPSDGRDNMTVHCLGGAEDLTTPRLAAPAGLVLERILGLESNMMKTTFGKWRLLTRPLACHAVGKATASRGPCLEGPLRCVCCRRDADDLVCKGARAVGEARASGFYARSHMAYHLFDSFQKRAFLEQPAIEWSNLSIAPLYRRALGLTDE